MMTTFESLNTYTLKYTLTVPTQCFNTLHCVWRDEEAPRLIPDPTVFKPASWIEDQEPFIPDPEAQAPHDWCVRQLQHTWLCSRVTLNTLSLSCEYIRHFTLALFTFHSNTFTNLNLIILFIAGLGLILSSDFCLRGGPHVLTMSKGVSSRF